MRDILHDGVTSYSGLSKFYFRRLLRAIIEIGNLDKSGHIILDFGCGTGELKKRLPHAQIIGYDIIATLSEIDNWQPIDFDIFVANEVFYSFCEDQLVSLLVELQKRTPAPDLIVGISRQNLLNKIGKFLFGKPNAHAATKLTPEDELRILKRFFYIVRKKNVMGLADVFLLRLKT